MQSLSYANNRRPLLAYTDSFKIAFSEKFAQQDDRRHTKDATLYVYVGMEASTTLYIGIYDQTW